MKYMMVLVLVAVAAVVASAEGILLQKVAGDVYVRHGVAETWTKIAAGSSLKPDDSMRTGKKGTATLVVNGTKRIILPPDVVVDVSDLRDLSQEELMLKLTMEKVRASSYQWKNEEMHIPNVAVVHGADKSASVPLSGDQLEMGNLEWNGTRVLFNNGYYSTSALKAMDVLRRYPPLAVKFENRLLVAEAMEKANLHGEALNEYVAIFRSDDLTPAQRDIIHKHIARLRKVNGE